MKFTLSSEESEILCLLEKTGNLREIAEIHGRDVSVISRRLQGLHGRYHLIEKENGRWRLTPKGLRFNAWVRSMMNEQERQLRFDHELVIASTREFAARILVPKLDEFRQKFSKIRILGTDQGIESLLLERKATIGFDCGAPYSPEIGFKPLCDETFSVVASPQWIRKHLSAKRKGLPKQHYIHYERNDFDTIRELVDQDGEITLTFSELNSLREALLCHSGWSYLPTYAISKELNEGLLKVIPGPEVEGTRFGVWWNQHSRPEPEVLAFCKAWLMQQKL